jgi:hypothetical protein
LTSHPCPNLTGSAFADGLAIDQESLQEIWFEIVVVDPDDADLIVLLNRVIAGPIAMPIEGCLLRFLDPRPLSESYPETLIASLLGLFERGVDGDLNAVDIRWLGVIVAALILGFDRQQHVHVHRIRIPI